MSKRILVVDDFATIRSFVRATLERRGYHTMGAANGTEAYKIITDETDGISLILTDYNMPDGTGFDLLKKIKSNPGTNDLPVIFLTTESNIQKIEAAKEAGLFAWIKKPYRSEAFFEIIERALALNTKTDLEIN
ncbi:MAG TPA: response regulator [Ohtaekwangia sp.]